LDGRDMDRVLRLDAKQDLVEVQAATPWTALVKHLAAQGCDLAAFSLEATVGDSVSRATAGPDGLPVTAHVVSLTLVTQDGELRRADRKTNAELFRLVLGGQGVIGVLYSVTLSLASLRQSAAAALEPVALAIGEPRPGYENSSIELLLPPAALESFLAELR